MEWIIRYERFLLRVMSGRAVLRGGRKIRVPPYVRVDEGIFDPKSKEKLQKEIDLTRMALSAISGVDYGIDLKRWADWYKDELKKRRNNK